VLSWEHGISSRGRQRLRGTGAAPHARGESARERAEPVGSSAPGGRAPAVGEPVGGRITGEGPGRAEASWPGGSQAAARCHRHPQDRAGIEARGFRVPLRGIRRLRAAAERLRRRQQLHVHFEPDDSFVFRLDLSNNAHGGFACSVPWFQVPAPDGYVVASLLTLLPSSNSIISIAYRPVDDVRRAANWRF